MQRVVSMLTALDPAAGAAAHVISRFDALVEAQAGPESILAAAAATTGRPVRLLDAGRGLDLRVDPDGRIQRDTGLRPDRAWPCAPLTHGGPPAIWLEHAGGSLSLLDAMVLERTAFATRAGLRRAPAAGCPDGTRRAALRTLLDAAAPPELRLAAAAVHGLAPGGRFRVVATSDAAPGIHPADLTCSSDTEAAGVAEATAPSDRRRGVGPGVGLLDLPESWRQATVALAFAARGDDRDPGPRTVHADRLGALTALAAGLAHGSRPADVDALDRARDAGSWALHTLDTFAARASLRLAAADLYLHHSTLRERITALERDLGWAVRAPQGRFRLQLALAARRYLLHPPESEPVFPQP